MIKKIKLSLLVSLLILIAQLIQAQNTVVLNPTKDAEVVYYNQSYQNTNFGEYTVFRSYAYSSGGANIQRGFMQFDLSSIPKNATIVSAKLRLFGLDHSIGNNISILHKLLSNLWHENTITWANQQYPNFNPSYPYSYYSMNLSDTIRIAASTSATQDYTLNMLKFIQAWVADPSTNYGMVLSLEASECYPNVPYAKMTFASSDNTDTSKVPRLIISYQVSAYTSSTAMNSVETISYDENGNVINQAKVYKDNLENPVQVLMRNISNDNVVVAQTVYDNYGRKVLQTLPAPVSQTNLNYVSNFIQDPSGGAYDYTDFDLPNSTWQPLSGEVDNPKNVNPSCLLGNYYSNNNTSEPFVATSGFPYSRVEISPTTGQPRRMSSPDENLMIGKGKTGYTYTVPANNELIHYAVNNGNPYFLDAGIEYENLTKTVNISRGDYNYVATNITYTTDDGRVVATCMRTDNIATATTNYIQSHGSIATAWPAITMRWN